MTANLENYREKPFVDFCTNELTEFSNSCQGVDAALLATPDGFEIASYSLAVSATDKLAAVSSSLFALGASLVNEFSVKDCKSIIVDSDNGKIFISTVKKRNHSLILMIQTNSQVTLGNIIHGSKKVNTAISERLGDI